MPLWHITCREIARRPGRAFLTLLSIIIGVAAVVAVDVATSTTRAAQQQMYQAVTGRSSLEVAADGGGDFADDTAEKLRSVPGIAAVLPGIQRTSMLYTDVDGDKKKVKVVVLGVDSENPAALSDFQVVAGQTLTPDGGALLDASFANSLSLHVGDEFRMLVKAGLKSVKIDGLVSSRTAAGAHLSLVCLPLSRAQTLFRAKGRIDLIQLALDEKADEDQVTREITSRLPTGLSVRSPAARSQLSKETLLVAELGLRLASGLSLLVTVFIILNTFLMNVSERRRQLSIMRAVGATRGQVLRMLLLEGLLMGLTGTLLGVGLGMIGANLCMTVMERMFQTTLPAAQISAGPVAFAAALGLGISLLGTYFPARAAGRISPLEGMGGIVESPSSRLRRLPSVTGAVILALGGVALAACLTGWLPVIFLVPDTILMLVALAMLIPLVLAPLVRLVSWSLRPALGVEGWLGQHQVLRRRTRTTLTVGVLFIAISVTIGLGNSVINNIHDLRRWFGMTVVGDFFIMVANPDLGTGLAANIPESMRQEVADIPGITNIDTAQFVPGKTGQGQAVVIIVREFTNPDGLALDIQQGDPDDTRGRLLAGEVVIGTALAQRSGLGMGDEIELATKTGPKKFRIAATGNTYTVGGLVVYMQREVARSYFDVDGVSAFMIKAAPEAQSSVQAALTAWCEKQGYLLQSKADLVQTLDRALISVIAALWVLLALALIVASFGIVNTLTMNVMEQTRELGLLRVVAMTRQQVRKLVLSQALIMGAIGLLPGLAAGVAVGYVMNLATLPMFGHQIPFVFHPILWAGCFVMALCIVLAAAWLPARRAARLDLVTALQYE